MMKSCALRLFAVLSVPLAFLIVGVFTLSDFGINWDEPKHLIRGQSYLHYILTGEHDFLNVPPYPQLKGAPDYIDNNIQFKRETEPVNSKDAGIRRSYYQSDFYTFDYFMTQHEHTHPEVNGLLAAISNYIFYQKLGVVGDLESYHLFIIFVTFLMILGIALWTWKHLGIFPSLVTSSSLALYPLVFAESHFNVKDPVLMAFFGLAILTFWYGFSRSRYLYIFLSSVCSGFALGTKFNAFFLLVILAPWVVFIIIQRLKKQKNKKLNILGLIGGTRVLGSLLAYPLVALGILFVFSPYLWGSPINRFLEIVNYYLAIGRGTPSELADYILGGWNIYPLVWFFYTTPLPLLFLSLLGVAYSLYLAIKKKNDIAFLTLLWFVVPIFRTVWPGMNIYGGVRQIMEFVPAMAVLSGFGVYILLKKFNKALVMLLVVISLGFVIYENARIHPNQNVYFNQLVGGLPGAYEAKIPSWGNTYGNVYLQGIDWLNNNAEPNAKLAMAINYVSAVPRMKLREDIDFNNAHWSGSRHQGEYVMEMNYDWYLKYRYKYSYFDTFFHPIYEVKVEGIPLLKIWKNDEEFMKSANEKEVIVKPKNIEILPSEGGKKLKIEFETEVYMTRLVIDHSDISCQRQEGVGYIIVSRDGKNFTREQDLLVDPESPYVTPEMDNDTYVFMFPARLARTIVLDTELPQPCILKNYKISTWVLDD